MAKIDKLLTQAQEHMAPGEQVIAAVQGTYEGRLMGEKITRAGILLATNQRLAFYAKRLAGYDFESFPYANISSFESGKNMMGRFIRFAASGNDVQLKWIADLSAFAQFVETVRDSMTHARSAPPPPAPQPVAATQHDMYEQLRKLGELRDAGVLTSQEFDAKKAELINRL
ncbi:PH domain-containing protein [Streptomyces sp. ISL-96]|uniref:PH domain-containing protein n=1 Tax=Streptomyces sp. ISL-96 TaxID=2819191 RepID=UPI001BE4E23C|nr:PH domain-containing protein [Streptomyces sp. ISL-96]MBT2488657.1 PH domain-containing protein [Streptomyces sp. ISL-96]